jgi:hypothetical protein
MSFIRTVAQYYDAENADKRDDIDLSLNWRKKWDTPSSRWGVGREGWCFL